MLPVRVEGSRASLDLFTLLDEGSTVTLINASVISRIGAKIIRVNVLLKGVGSDDSIAMSTEKVNLRIHSESSIFELKNVLIVKNLALPMHHVDGGLVDLCAKVTGVSIKKFRAVPDMLIGQDNCELIVTREFREIVGKSLVVSRCALGWSIHGGYSDHSVRQVNLLERSPLTLSEQDLELDKVVKSYFDIESLGSDKPGTKDPKTKRAFEILEKTSRYVNNAWEVGLLWRNDDINFPNSRPHALRRLYLLEKRFDRDPEYAEMYHREMTRLFEEGFAVEAKGAPEGRRVWYLPHFGVSNRNKPGKVRLVFDAAAKTDNTSFNDLLIPSQNLPDLLKSLLGVIMRFRQFVFAMKADMKDMFLMIRVRPEDRDAQRFLYRRKRDEKPKECIMLSMLFGASPSPVSALFIKNKNANKFSARYPVTAKSIEEDCYMDDFLESCQSIEEATNRVTEVIEISAHANWLMHGWASNHPEILKNIVASNSCWQLVKPDSQGTEKVLGLRWLNSSDELTFDVNFRKIDNGLLDGSRRPTKREFLALIMSIFDPLGFISPFTIQSRILMQNVWSSGVGWDETLLENEFLAWKRWVNNLKLIKQCRISRCYQLKSSQLNFAELHVFGDASLKAFAAVAYWRFPLANGQFHTAFIMSKARVAPLKVMSIPRLELQAAVLATRIAQIIAAEHKFTITRRVFWCDSKSVLLWIRKDPREFKVFVANRLDEIRDNSEVSEWKWVPTKENPADDSTREALEALDRDSRWFLGPSFLRKPCNYWPKENFDSKNIDVSENRAVVCATTTLSVPIDVSRFSKWLRLVATVARVLHAIDIWRKYRRSPTERILSAESKCFMMSQQLSFPEELAEINRCGKIPKSSRIFNLNAYLDEEGILRANSRVINLTGNESLAKPIILDGKDHGTRLLIAHYHEKFYHANHESVLNELKQRFWIVGLRNVLRTIIAKCVICKLRRARPCNPSMAALPPSRVTYGHRPFVNTGLDYFGPMMVTIGRRREKRWGVIFTCMSTRAVHLELAYSLSTDSAICALRRFSARRGTPSRIFCDNGTNFRGMSSELARAIGNLSETQLQEFASQNKIEWVFNPPSAPHMGGAWERLIRSVKSCLSVVLKEQAPKEETLTTLLAEVEHAVNSRPLTHVSLNPDDLEALTPNHFLLGTSSGQIKISAYDEQTLCTRKQWLFAQKLADDFWRRWVREYIPTLISRKKWQKEEEPLKVNDAVLIIDYNVERNHWKKGIITRTLPGTDGQVRVAEVKTANGTLLRPTRKLIKFSD